MLTSTSKKIPKYFCNKCLTGTNNKKDFHKHLATYKHTKHESLTNFEHNVTNLPQLSPDHTCVNCKKKYKSRAGLWYHLKKCKNGLEKSLKPQVDQVNKEPSDKQLIMMLLKENSDMKNLVLEVCQKIQPSIITNNTNSHNKTFNLNFFLNETCKNAMNIMDFVDSLKLQLNDLERMGEIGFVNGMSNIIIKNLQNMDVTERPVHCTDQKREVIYVKDENKWDKEEETKPKLRKAIKHIAHKNAKLIGEFKTKHPDYCKSASKISTQYNTMVIEAMGGIGCNDLINENKIIKRISNEILVDKKGE
jgi:hypothetical protein